ncbi:hypothetical protein SARC_04680 [Sphaeroforma arctica JP610]|uniref:JNK/Rab-associated protein-1 N-terminal domain-containing protein n=1 Tax=Sphaeroforma arctica JP610 TaxID=667725 RepID=A0A0L0G1S0_9EUKA|nr:hypothetical protein SARC_04680 [Sphaeroforma arctica JP610]KNC83062.1 hypothetical protein SARC_04680 [Sphaeroforma arctica JP610]|eukprot:XP_014156964.1 hypothetical protein SARC_04680 [Sphaeroforma arctica JP610]
MSKTSIDEELASQAEKAVKSFVQELDDVKPFVYEGQVAREKLQSTVGHFTDIANEMGGVNVKHSLSHIIETLKLKSDIMKTLEEDKVSLKEANVVLKEENTVLKEENARLSQRLELISERRADDRYKHADELKEIRAKLDLANVQIMRLGMTAPMRKRLKLDD